MGYHWFLLRAVVRTGIRPLAGSEGGSRAGRRGGGDSTMAFVGGNCSLQGFDQEGDEAFWTVTRDEVRR